MEKTNTSYYKSPIGWIEIVADNDSLLSINFVKKKGNEAPNAITKETLKQLKEYFSGKRKKFEGKLNFDGTDFQKRVLKAMMQIPYGKTVSYRELARKAGRATAARAVGTVCSTNDLPIIIPCHRVVASDGSLGGYSGGLEKKKWMLAMEQRP
jgi:O-6-methylguanine DNA methyltransferase